MRIGLESVPMKDAALKPCPACLRAGVLLPLPLSGAYDYRLADPLPRGTIVIAPLGAREALGVVWSKGEGAIADARLKDATPLEGNPKLPEHLCDFIDWVARYTLAPPGAVLALALRTRQAFEPEIPRIAYARGAVTPKRMTPARERALALAGDGLARSVPALAQEANVTPQVVRGLIDCGALVETELPEFSPLGIPDPDYAHTTFNTEQKLAADALSADVRAGKYSVTLLDGVTGSGKTETYFDAVAEALRCGKQTLILLPEIALTVQFLERFAERFGCRPAEWHSDLSQKERRRNYRAVMSGEARVVVGARSALFLPFHELGLIIVDEEHEQAYKQEDGVIYNARDMAVVRGHIEQCPVVLASATPSLETYVNATSGRYHWLKLAERHGLANMPAIRMIDLRQAHGETGTWISPPLREALAATLLSGEQAMLFLNRRGYAPLTLCEACGHKMICRNCSAWLVEHRYHRGSPAIIAASDANSHPLPTLQCRENAGGVRARRRARGGGIRGIFPEARMAIASSDTMHGPAETQAAIRAMAKREIDVLVGTQIVAKGHHFPQLTLVGVVDADLGGRTAICVRANARSRCCTRCRDARPRRTAGTCADSNTQPGRCGDASLGQRRPQRISRTGTCLPRTRRRTAFRTAGRTHSFKPGRRSRARCGTNAGKAGTIRTRYKSLGTDSGVLSPAPRPNARAAVAADRTQRRHPSLSACVAGAGEIARVAFVSPWMSIRSAFFEAGVEQETASPAGQIEEAEACCRRSSRETAPPADPINATGRPSRPCWAAGSRGWAGRRG